MADPLINLAVVGPYHNLFTYSVRAQDAVGLHRGCRFLIPFGNSLKIGFFVDVQHEPVDYRLRYVKERIDIAPPLPGHLFDFCLWIADYYFAGPGEVLAAAIPGTGRRKPKTTYVPTDRQFFEKFESKSAPGGILAHKFLRSGEIKEATLAGNKQHLALIKEWLAAGVIRPRYHIREKRKKLIGFRLGATAGTDLTHPSDDMPGLDPGIVYTRCELAARTGLSAYRIDKLVKSGALEKAFDESGLSDLTTYPIRHDLPSLPLLAGQQTTLDEIATAVRRNAFDPFLLFGVTGSGKTLVYCHAAKAAIDAGGSVLVLVPEIALSGLLLSSIAAFFGDRVAVIHSGLTANERLAVRERIASGHVRVVIGPRSAIFSPLENLRLIVVDEEHDPSYKQADPAPRYHARDAAVMLARIVSCPIVLGSASPSVESYHNALCGRYRLLTLDQRPKSGYRMPKIEMLDMKSEKISGECSFLSFRLKLETERRIAEGGQVIYYLNRRGFSPRLKCRDCGEAPSCPDCGVTLTYHKPGRLLKCHFCDRVEPAPEKCPKCGSVDFLYLGAGTQRVEENLTRLFADVRPVRIDSDRTATKSGRLILGDFAEEKYNLLVGTQMVTKGLDFPNMTLVGVLSADIGLDMPDFRAAEKTYARLLQVAGRTGRGDREGLVMIQTYYSDHPVIRYLQKGSYPPFYEAIIEERRQLFYPPFSRLINVTLSSTDEKLLEKESLRFRFRLEEKLTGLSSSDNKGVPSHAVPGGPPFRVGKGGPPLAVGNVGDPLSTVGNGAHSAHHQIRTSGQPGFCLLGPAPAPMYKLRGNFRRRLLIKTTAVKKIISRLRAWELTEKSFGLPAKVKAIIDVDPMDMM